MNIPETETEALDRLWRQIEESAIRGDDSAARIHLAAGRAIYYSEDATPEGLIIKEEGGDTIIKTLPPLRQ